MYYKIKNRGTILIREGIVKESNIICQKKKIIYPQGITKTLAVTIFFNKFLIFWQKKSIQHVLRSSHLRHKVSQHQ